MFACISKCKNSDYLPTANYEMIVFSWNSSSTFLFFRTFVATANLIKHE